MTAWLTSLLSSSDFWTVLAVGVLQPVSQVLANRLVNGKKDPPDASSR
jgi:hypothetical protein